MRCTAGFGYQRLAHVSKPRALRLRQRIAFIGTALTGLSALLAMLVLVLQAFFGAGLARDCAKSAEFIDQGTFAGHQHLR